MNSRLFLLTTASVLALAVTVLPPFAPTAYAARAWALCDRCGLAYPIDRLFGVKYDARLLLCERCVEPGEVRALTVWQPPSPSMSGAGRRFPDWVGM